jgi:hypothetical protein
MCFLYIVDIQLIFGYFLFNRYVVLYIKFEYVTLQI